jgi:glycogen synthase
LNLVHKIVVDRHVKKEKCMKALFLTREFPPHVYGGAGVHVEYLSKELAELMEVEVRCFGDQHYNLQNLACQGYPFEDPIFANSSEKLKQALMTLRTCIHINADPVDANIVHCHTWYSHFAGILAKICYGIPMVLTTHSLEPLRPWKREQLGTGYDLSSWVERTAMDMADAIIAVSQETKEDVLKHFDVNPDKIKMIYNGIDIEEYKPTKDVSALKKYGVNPDMPYVLFVGRITRQKGIVHLVNAIKYMNKDVQVVLCAGAPDTKEIAKEMEDKVNEVKKEHPNVIWIQEMLDKPSVIQMYSNAAVFCCPSIYEPFGIINLEAMATRTAVVASAVGGIKEVVVPGETGLLVPVEQQQVAPFEPVNAEKFSKDLAEAVNKILDNPEMRDSMAQKGMERARNLFSWKAIAQQTKELYESLV